jgi:signal transduction histidine kinase/CheY-like chemotaxis protein
VRYISHELRTPLNTAFLGLKLLSSDLKASNDPKDIERYDTLCDVNMSCTAAVDILNDLLCYEKLESGILELHKEEIVVAAYLKDRISMFSAQARECGVTISTVTDAADRDIEATPDGYDGKILSKSLLPTDSIFADKFKMDQVIRNLISNALKFTPRGGVVTIKATFVHDRSRFENKSKRSVKNKSISLRNLIRNPSSVASYPNYPIPSPIPSPVSGKLIVVVTDTGAGISKENQARLFNEIVQFNPEKLQAGGGSGLGLWITQEILNLHDGSISVSSEGEGMGSSFTFEMPMTRCPPLLLQTSHRSKARIPPLSSPSREASTTEEEHSPVTQTSIRLCNELPPPVSGVDNADSFSCPEDAAPMFEVLVVDDSRLCRKMLQKCLRADGHICFEAEDGLEAIAMVTKRINHANGVHGRPFDAILMDFVMPNMDGPTATKEIRALGYTAPIFGVTGNGD